ncbi:hypothetical protein EAI_03139 [Harpegnathos saltator]|uniref:Uncharacterized protein n=1 Tax=Harpegnathos saltator TaxID=610380 RepID=E2B731_HARSA|nr:hypothetical protein EAI_03139 [Harpegnathos saltator]
MTGKVLTLICLVLYCRADGSCASRVKRQGLLPPPIVYPFGGTFKLVVGFAVPVELSGRILVYGQNFQFQYALPPNATFFTEFFEGASSSRRRRASVSRDERMTVYGLLEGEFERPQAQEAANSSVDSEYLEAFEFGRSNHDCSRIYRSCLPGQGILDQISSVIL